jgi:hypothetical protein
MERREEMSRRKEKMEVMWNVRLDRETGFMTDRIDKSLVPLLLDKLTSAGKVDKDEVKYVTHRV